jgi:hypothetical protein
LDDECRHYWDTDDEDDETAMCERCHLERWELEVEAAP